VPDYQITTAHDNPALSTIWLTTTIDQTGHTDHAVPHEELATRSGSYTAVCGATIYPTSMMTPPGPQCTRCATNLETTAQQQRSQHSPTNRYKPSRFLRILWRGRD
jgi:hypothetical protein